jgi:hypothetical protein
MEAWIAENPKSAAYMLYLSAIVVFVSLIALYYYTRSQEYLKELQQTKTSRVVSRSIPSDSKPPLISEKKDKTVEEKDGFTIISN